jgi:hypothetical protein
MGNRHERALAPRRSSDARHLRLRRGVLHIDADEYILACGSDPASEADRQAARRVIACVCAQHGTVVVETD